MNGLRGWISRNPDLVVLIGATLVMALILSR